MINQEWMFVAIGLAVFQMVCLLIRLKKNLAMAKVKRLLRATRKLHSGSQVGDYVQFEGRVKYPVDETPYRQTPCSLWFARVTAEFTRKKKAPSNGYVTHRPMLISKSNDHEPAILSDGKHRVHLLLDRVAASTIDAVHKTSKSKTPQHEDIQALSKPKYEQYVIDEYSLPRNAKVRMLAEVANHSDACTTLAFSQDPNKPTLLIHGDGKGYLARLNRATKATFFAFLLFAAFHAYAFLVKHSVSASLNLVIAGAVGTLVMIFILKKFFRFE